MQQTKDSLAIIIPMFNEEKVATKCVDAVIKAIRNLLNHTTLVIINDGSTDKTKLLLEKKQKQYPQDLIIITLKKNAGYGGATQKGIAYALKNKFEWSLHMDSDLTNDPKYIKDFVKCMSPSIDCVKASRYIKGGVVRHVPLFRRLISIVGNQVASSLFDIGIRDCTNGFRMIKTSCYRNIKFKEKNFSIILEELYYLKKLQARCIEIPYTLTARVDSVSHFKYNKQILFDYFKYAFKALTA